MDADRWATFDCYGTLIDWDAGITATLADLLGADDAGRLLDRYHAIEPEVQAEAYRTYREVLDLVAAAIAAERGDPLSGQRATAMSRSLATWPAFPEVPAALADARDRGWRLAILSNCDRDLIETSLPKLGVAFDDVIVAEDVGAYKPAPAHWQRFEERHPDARGRHVHVGASPFHDIAPAADLGLPSVWINRVGEPADLRAGATLADLSRLSAALDALLPA